MGPFDPLHTDHRPRDGLSALLDDRGIPIIAGIPPKGAMRSLFKLGGYFASGILIVLGAGTVVVGALDFTEVRDTIAQEDITATPTRGSRAPTWTRFR